MKSSHSMLATMSIIVGVFGCIVLSILLYYRAATHVLPQYRLCAHAVASNTSTSTVAACMRQYGNVR